MRTVHRVAVPFQGDGSGVEELTWGQRTLWQAMDRLGTWLPIGATTPLPPGTTVADAAEQLRFWTSRYQTMRTRLRFDPGGPRQVVSSEGETGLDVVEVDDGEDPAKVAAQVEQDYRTTEYDFADEWPVRMAVVRHRGSLTHRVLIMCHLVTDAAGTAIMVRDLADRDPRSGAAARPPATMQPLAQARWQRTPAARRVSDAAVRFAENVARTMPARRFGDSADPRRPRYWQLGFDSPATDLAMRAITARTGADAASLMLAVYAIAQARVSGTNPAVAHIMVHNRFRRELADTVAPNSQAGLFMVDVGGVTFDQALAQARRRAMVTYKHSYYDQLSKEGLEERIGAERGEPLHIGCFFNDRRPPAVQAGSGDGAPVPSPEQVRVAREQTALQCQLQQDEPFESLFIHVENVPGTVHITAQADTHYISLADLEALLREMEETAVEAAFDGGAPTRVAASTGPVPGQ